MYKNDENDKKNNKTFMRQELHFNKKNIYRFLGYVGVFWSFSWNFRLN